MIKKKLPHGFIKRVSLEAKTVAQSTGYVLGAYKSTTIGVSDETSRNIKEAAIKVADEIIKEMEELKREFEVSH